MGLSPRAAALVGLAILSVVSHAQAEDGPSIAERAAGLGSADASVRAATIEALRTLEPSEHDAIVERIGHLARRAPETDRSDEILTALRRATGSRRADDVVDVADGVGPVLDAGRDDATRRITEAILLARSLERHGTPASLRAAAEVYRFPGNGWEMEGRRYTLRMGERVAGAALRSLSHGDVHVREWARWTVRRLGADLPGTFVRGLSPSVLSDVLVAYGDARLMVAMPIVGSFVDAPQRSVREAAFAGLAAYGRNALWVIREAYRLHADEDAPTEWGAERTLTALRAAIDERRLASARAALGDAEAALAAGDATHAAELADAVLLARPELGSVEIARIYFAAAEATLARGDGARALALSSRAERLATLGGDGALAHRARGLSTFVRAEGALAHGVLDVDAYARAAAAVPGDARIASIAEEYGSAPVDADRTWPLGMASFLFAALAVVLFVGKPTRAPSAPSVSAPSAPETPMPVEGDAAITSPG